MALTELAEKAIDTVKSIFTNHDGLVKAREDLLAKHEAAARERQAEIDRLKRALEEWKRPEKALADAAATALGLSNLEQRELATLERELEKHQTPEHERFAKWLERLYERVRTMEPPTAVEAINRLDDSRRITNVEEIERYLVAVSGPRDPDPMRRGQRLPSALARAQRACADELWKLPQAEQHRRIAELRTAIEASFEGTQLETELG
jgi:hypothetical protein